MPPVLRQSTINQRVFCRSIPRVPRGPGIVAVQQDDDIIPNNETNSSVSGLRRSARIAQIKANQHQEVNIIQSQNQNQNSSISGVRSSQAFDNNDLEVDITSSDQNKNSAISGLSIILYIDIEEDQKVDIIPTKQNKNSAISGLRTSKGMENIDAIEEYQEVDIIQTNQNQNINSTISGLRSPRNPNTVTREHKEEDIHLSNQNQNINSPISGLRRSTRIASMNAKKQCLVDDLDNKEQVVVKDKRVRGTKKPQLKKKKPKKSSLKKLPARTRTPYMRGQVNNTAEAFVQRRMLQNRNTIRGNSFQLLRAFWLGLWSLLWKR